MLIVMKDRDIHALTKLTLNIETFRCFDVLKHDAAEGGLERGDNIDQLLRVSLIDF